MQLKLRVLADGVADDVLVAVDPRATVGELAVALFPDSVPCLASVDTLGLVVDVDSAMRRVVAPATTIDESGLRSGCSVGPSTSAPTSSSAPEDAAANVDGARRPGCTDDAAAPRWSQHRRSRA